MSTSKHRVLTKADLRGFCPESVELIMQAMDAGLTGYISNKGHAILHNDNGGTASVTRSMSVPNRTGQNSRAAVRRIIAAHKGPVRTTEQAPAPMARRTITVAEAFVEYGSDFSTWYDSLPKGLPGQALLVVSQNGSSPTFSVVETQNQDELSQPDPEVTTDKEPEMQTDPALTCPECGRPCASPAGLGAHRRTHRGPKNDLQGQDRSTEKPVKKTEPDAPTATSTPATRSTVPDKEPEPVQARQDKNNTPSLEEAIDALADQVNDLKKQAGSLSRSVTTLRRALAEERRRNEAYQAQIELITEVLSA